MPSGEYESVSKNDAPAAADEAPVAVDRNTARFAMVVSVLSCAVSIVAISFIVLSLKV